MPKIFLFGCGEMGKIILQSLLNLGKYQKQQIVIVTRGDKEELAKQLGIGYTKKPQLGAADILFFALPPQAASSCLLALNLQPTNLIISVMAGYSMESMEQFCKGVCMIRSMPNLLIKEKKGFTAYFCSDNCTTKHRQFFLDIFQPISELIEVDEEDRLNACTAVFGSGVGFIFYLMKAYFEAVIEMGFALQEAKKITYHLFQDSSFFIQNSKSTFQEVVEQVCTKGGTTAAGIFVFKQNKVDKTIKEGIIKAYERSKELAKG